MPEAPAWSRRFLSGPHSEKTTGNRGGNRCWNLSTKDEQRITGALISRLEFRRGWG